MKEEEEEERRKYRQQQQQQKKLVFLGCCFSLVAFVWTVRGGHELFNHMREYSFDPMQIGFFSSMECIAALPALIHRLSVDSSRSCSDASRVNDIPSASFFFFFFPLAALRRRVGYIVV